MLKIGIFGANSFLVENIKKNLSKINQVYLIGRKNADIETNYTKKSIERIFITNNFDIVINATGYTNIEKCEKNKITAYYVNVKISEYICKAIKKFNKKNYLIHFSTDHLYDGKFLSKETDVNIINNYALTKYQSEKYAASVNSIILRTNFFGKSTHNSKKSLSDWIILNLKNKKKIYLYKDIYFSPLHFSTIINVIDLIIKKRKNGTFNLGSKKGFSKLKFGKEIAITKNLDANLIIPTIYKNKIKRPNNMMMDISKFEKKFNYKLPTLKEEIKKIK
jgi:dTDP-4-dehydrorhamnose reductase